LLLIVSELISAAWNGRVDASSHGAQQRMTQRAAESGI